MTPTEALTKLQAARRVKSAWLPGMRVMVRSWRGVAVEVERLDEWRNHSPGCDVAHAIIDTDDPATVGCLLALWHEAAQSASDLAVVDEAFDDLNEAMPFSTHGDGVARVGAALSAALIALAAAL